VTGNQAVATDGKKVSLHYTGTLADGSVFDSSDGREPLTFTLGARQVIPGFESAVAGMHVGQKKTFTVPKDQAYPHHAEMVITMPRTQVPPDMTLEQGMTLALKSPAGEVIPAVVVKLDDENVTLDLNPAVAGKDLTFTVEVVTIE
jgi:peptidylprolyl isomerase